jgi:hypothetical protein
MHGDFSLNPTYYRDRVSRVLQQMGRVQLDSDWNEQTESVLRFLRGLAADVIGAHGGVESGFKITPDSKDAKVPFRVNWGFYYVDGIRCVNLPRNVEFWDVVGDPDAQKKFGDGLSILEQEDSFWPAKDDAENDPQNRTGRLLYLAVWERHISSAEDDSIREVALGGPDTASRAVVVWQIRSMPAEPVTTLAKKLDLPPYDPNYLALNLLLRSSARMKARAIVNTDTDPCTISPEARYRGMENRLYRVEVHDSVAGNITFKWSQDNAAIVYPVRAPIEGTTVKLESLGRDERTAIRKNDWVEVVDDEITLKRKVNRLVQVIDVDRHAMTVTLSDSPADNAGDDAKKRPILRRWAADAQPLKENQWVELSDGVEVQFSSVKAPQGGFRTGDYWLVPTRTATGDVLWPGEPSDPQALGPHGVDEHYAPLALWKTGATGGAGAFTDLRFTFEPLAKKV